MSFELLQRLGVALAIGLLVGLERGWQTRDEAEGERTAGLRTFALSGLLGGVAASLATATGPVVLAAALLAHTAAVGAFSWLEARAQGAFSVTGVVAATLTFSLGAYAVLGDLQVAAAAAVAMTILLALKKPLHSWLRRIEWMEIRAALILLAMTFLLLPLLPDRPVDPWGAVNPSRIWILAIAVAVISFAGYGLVKLLGDQAGIALAAAAGGLASSTATTATLARLARVHPEGSRLLAGGIVLSGGVMAARIVIIAAALNPALALALLPPFGAAAAAMLAGAGLLLWGDRGDAATRPALRFANPLDLSATLKIAGVIAVVVLASSIAVQRFGTAGILVVAALSGLADVDAITLSMARMAPAELAMVTAVAAVGVCAAVNTVVKAAMTFALGTARAGLLVTAVSAAAVAAGAAAMALF